ncbi:MAG TPA: cytochrome c, partial [Microvirga sp.]|nr:cytochrome c [Microvirga sp.]
MRKAIVGLLVLAVLGALGFWGLTSPAAYRLIRGGDAAAPAANRQPDLENGRIQFYAGGCTSCHATPNQDDKLRLGGGYALKSPFGTFHVPNISPHKQDGIGSWTAADFTRAMREGTSPDGRHYYPAFPYTSYQRMNAEELADLFAFMMTLQPVEGRAP